MVVSSTEDSGQRRLKELGYKQELKRDISVIANFALCFSIISIPMGVTTLYNTGLNYGGPISMIYGWLIVGTFTMLIALSMAEICSAFPTSGGLYYWSFRLAGPKWGPFAAWLTGWYNVVGQWAGTASVNYSLATLLQIIILLSTGGANHGGYLASKYMVLGFHGAVLFVQALINCLPITWLAFLGNLAAGWNVFRTAVFFIIILVPAVSPTKATPKFVFQYFNSQNSDGIHNSTYIFLLGLLMSQYSLLGYDAAAHMSEETKSSDKNGPYGILSAVAISFLAGWAYLLGITFVVTDISHVLDPRNDANGYAVAQVFYDAFKYRYGSGMGGILCLGVVAIAAFFCGMGSITSNSRMVYAFSRDGAMPLSRFWHTVNKQDVPLNAVWLSAAVAFVMALTSIGSNVAFQAMASIATVGLLIAYAIPIFFRVTVSCKTFQDGPFSLGSFSLWIGWMSVLWVAITTVLFSLPVAYPVTKTTLNYTPVAVGGLFMFVAGSWLISARFSFKGPVATATEAPTTSVF